MPEPLTPQAIVIERDAEAFVTPTGQSISGMLVTSKRGPDNSLTFISDLGQYERRYGGDDGGYGWVSVKGYFDKVGSTGAGLYVGRVFGAGAAKAVSPLIPADRPEYESVVAVAITNAVIANELEAGDLIDGVVLSTGDRVLLQNQTAPAENGIYVAVASGAASRSTDMDTVAEVVLNKIVKVTGGTVGANTYWRVNAVPATIDMDPLGLVAYTEAPDLEASSVGAWANDAFLTAQKWATGINATNDGAYKTANGNNAIDLDSVDSIEIGDVVRITEDALFFVGIVVDYDAANNRVWFRQDIAATFTTAAEASCASTHQVQTTLGATYNTGVQVQLASVAGVRVGSLLLIVGYAGTAPSPTLNRVVEFRVTALNGNIATGVVLQADGSASIPAADSWVVSIGFDVRIDVDGEATNTQFLSLESQDAVNYFITALQQTEYLRGIVGTVSPDSYRSFIYPRAFMNVSPTGGLDGSAPVDNDWQGTNPAKTYQHGFLLFDNVENLPQWGIPAASTVVQRASDVYTQGRGDSTFVMEAPLTADTLAELQEYRGVTLNVNSSYSALYAPWLVEPDNLVPGAERNIPPTGKVLGTYSEVSARRGTQKAPANELLPNVNSVVANFTNTQHGILNGAGVNLIRRKIGRGIRVMGSRTLWPQADRKEQVNVRRILNAVKRGLLVFGETLVFEPSDEDLWTRIQESGLDFLELLWKQGWFFPRNDPDAAFSFVCNEKTNTEALRTSFIVRSVAGISPVLPGEQIQFELGLIAPGQAVVNEI